MSYPYIGSAHLGSSKAASTITATVVDLTGAAVASQPTKTVVNLGGGVFGVSIPDMADGQTGFVLLLESATVLAALTVSPREVENADAKTSSRSTFATGGSVNVTQVGGVTATGTAGGVVFPNVVSSYAGADTSGTTTLLGRVTAAVALASQIPANFTTATFASAGVFSSGALANAPAAPTAAATAAAVWDLAASGHATAGTFGALAAAAGSAGDPWATALPGGYTAGQAGYVLGTNLNATVSSRSTYAGGAVASVTAPVTVGTNGDKTGYSLTQAFPSNFAALGLTAGGKVSGVVLADTVTTYTGNTPQTGDAFARIGAAGAGLTAIGDTRVANLDAAVSTRSTFDGTAVGTVTDKAGYALSAAGLDAVVIETALNARQALALVAAEAAGVISGQAANTPTIKGAGVTTDRISATTDADGNRLTVTLSPPA